MVQTLKQLIGIFRYAKIPDVLGLLNNFAVADIALSALRILVGKDNLARRAVVDKRLIPESESMLKHFEENPLGPLVILLLSGVDYSCPVKGEAHPFKLA